MEDLGGTNGGGDLSGASDEVGVGVGVEGVGCVDTRGGGVCTATVIVCAVGLNEQTLRRDKVDAIAIPCAVPGERRGDTEVGSAAPFVFVETLL